MLLKGNYSSGVLQSLDAYPSLSGDEESYMPVRVPIRFNLFRPIVRIAVDVLRGTPCPCFSLTIGGDDVVVSYPSSRKNPQAVEIFLGYIDTGFDVTREEAVRFLEDYMSHVLKADQDGRKADLGIEFTGDFRD